LKLSVSKGPKQSTVPNVTNQDEKSARSTLKASGFKVAVVRQDENDPGLDGIVVSQDPTGGTRADQGSTVTITVGHYVPPGQSPGAFASRSCSADGPPSTRSRSPRHDRCSTPWTPSGTRRSRSRSAAAAAGSWEPAPTAP